MDKINIQFTLFSAFYSPLISAMSGGFLEAEGLDPDWSIAAPGYAQQQGPFPQQLQADGIGHVVAQVGKQIGPCGFSSLAATRAWLETDMAKAFMRAYLNTRVYLNETPAREIAKAERSYFPDIDEGVLADCIGTYQQLGCWTRHVEITRAAYEKTLDVFEYVGLLKRRYRYEEVCVAPPATE